MVAEWVPLAIATVMLLGVASVISKYALSNAPSTTLMICSLIVITPISAIILVANYSVTGFEGLQAEYVAIGLVASLFASLGFYLYFDALERGPVMVVGSVSSAYPVIIIAVALLVLNESVNIIQAAGGILIVTCVVVLMHYHGASGSKTTCPRSALILSILALLSWGVWGILIKIALMELDVFFFVGLSAFIIPPLTLTYLKLRNRGKKIILPKYSPALAFAIISVELEQIGFYSETYAVDSGPATLVFPVIASYPVATVVLAYLFLKERLTLKEMLLILGVVTGIVLVSVI